MPSFLSNFDVLVSLIQAIVSRKINVYLHRIFESNLIEMNSVEAQSLRFEDTQKFYDEYLVAKKILRNFGYIQEYYPKELETSFCIAKKQRDVIFTPDGKIKKCVREIAGPAAEPSRNENAVKISNVEKKESILRESFYIDNIVPKDSICGVCNFLPICHGGCVKDIYEKPNDVLKRCTPWRFILKNELNNFLTKINNEEIKG